MTIEIAVENMNPAIDFLELDISFDLAELSFVEDSWFDSDALFDFGAFGDAFLGLSDDNLIVQASFLDGIVDFIGSSFALVTVEFEAQSDIDNPTVVIDTIFAQNFDFMVIDEDDLQAQVSTPATALFILVGVVLMTRRRLM